MLLDSVGPFLASFLATLLVLGAFFGAYVALAEGRGATAPPADGDLPALKSCDMVVVQMPCGGLAGGMQTAQPKPQSCEQV